MNKIKNTLLIVLMIFSAYSCDDKIVEIFVANSPIYMSYEDLAKSVKQTNSRKLNIPGKIYFKDNYLFVIEDKTGIHIIDNADPVNPQNISFIDVPGVVDMSIKGDVLYVDSYVDLVAISLADLNNITEIKRIRDVFPYTLPTYDEDYPLAQIDQEKGVVIGWEIKTIRQEVEDRYYPVYWEGGMFLDAASSSNSFADISGSGFGVGGSMARFGISENTLYSVDDSMLHIFDITNANNPINYGEFYAGWMIETLFISGDKLFLGGRDGVRIIDIVNPRFPQYLSQFRHVMGCDPVVVSDTLAYVTLKGGNACGNSLDRLDVLSVADYSNPRLIATYMMKGPNGLGIDGNTLFVCDGEAGLKVYDVTDPLKIDQNMIANFPGIIAVDVIPYNGLLFLIAEDGFYQYNYDNLNAIQLISKIEVVPIAK
ncbi:MAG: hypothetical protein PF484_09990 [Bacteroidales bacterium]|jgi:hypothetical protein|nr:hypothetical protein [Bacteroidales bacterium]